MRQIKMMRFAACAAAVAAFSAFGGEVAQDEARDAVRGWAALQEALTGKERFSADGVAKVETYQGRDGRGSFHVVSFEGGGFAVTSGDTEIAPILAYSEDGEFVAGDENPLWVMLTRDVAGRMKRLDSLAASASAKATAENKNTKSTKAGGSSSSTTDDEDDLEYGAEEERGKDGDLHRSLTLEFPIVNGIGGGVRAYDYEVAVDAICFGGNAQRGVKRYFSPKCHFAPSADTGTMTVTYGLDEFKAWNSLKSRNWGALHVAVRPRETFGGVGRALEADVKAAERIGT